MSRFATITSCAARRTGVSSNGEPTIGCCYRSLSSLYAINGSAPGAAMSTSSLVLPGNPFFAQSNISCDSSHTSSPLANLRLASNLSSSRQYHRGSPAYTITAKAAYRSTVKKGQAKAASDAVAATAAKEKDAEAEEAEVADILEGSKKNTDGLFVPGRATGHLEEHRSNDGGKPYVPSGPRGTRPISLDVDQMSDDELVLLSAFENHQARKEIVKRHIMDVDNVTYDRACKIFGQIERKNQDGLALVSLPYKAGIAGVVAFGVISIPMVFHLPTIHWFNEWAVTTDVPEPRDLETPLEVSIWSWNWMEPSLGTFSFILLCSQYAREKMDNLGVKPYTRWIKRRRGQRLADNFSRYDPKILIAYSETASLADDENTASGVDWYTATGAKLVNHKRHGD